VITRVLSVGLLAGLLAGLLVSAVQHFTATPLILAAEEYETASRALSPDQLASEDGVARLILVHNAHDHAHGGDDGGWQPADGFERTFYTGVTTVATAIGFAFLLLAGLLMADVRIDESQALGWAAAGFVATGLAPALGLAPELPGMQAADLLARQAWWLATAAATAVALWLFFRSDTLLLKAAAVVLIVAPHVIGAPHPHDLAPSRVPAELAARFAATSLVTHALLWALTGWIAGRLWQRGEAPSSAS
jgi:cobalt transporter subunit CbtA